MKQLLALALLAPLAACIDDSDDENSVEITGELPSSDFAAPANLARAGSVVGSESQGVFDEGLFGAFSVSGNAQANSGTSMQSRELIVDAAACDDSGTLSLDVNQSALTFIFSECDNGESTIDGNLGFTLSGDLQTFVDNIDAGIFDFGFNADYQEIKITQGNDFININGNITTEYAFSASDWEYDVSSRSLAYSDSDDHDFTLQNFDFEMDGDIASAAGSSNVSWQYDYYVTNDDGTFHVKSDGEIELENGTSELRTGIIYIEGTNAILTINLDADAAQSDDQVKFSLDLNKDDTEDATGSMSQATFYGWPSI